MIPEIVDEHKLAFALIAVGLVALGAVADYYVTLDNPKYVSQVMKETITIGNSTSIITETTSIPYASFKYDNGQYHGMINLPGGVHEEIGNNISAGNSNICINGNEAIRC